MAKVRKLYKVCTQCAGKGATIDGPCPKCLGFGVVLDAYVTEARYDIPGIPSASVKATKPKQPSKKIVKKTVKIVAKKKGK